MRSPTIAIVGAGNLGSALAIALDRAGYSISEVVSRPALSSQRRARTLARKVGARATVINDPKSTAQTVWLCVPDREIAPCALRLASRISGWKGMIVLHPSGSLTSDALETLRNQGASVASAHPLMTFVPGTQPSLEGVGFAVEGDRAAVRVVRQMVARVGGEFFPISKKRKAAYHTWATFTSPLLTALLAVAEEVARTAGISRAEARRRVIPILRETLDNYAHFGPRASFSGAIIRGDTATVNRHLQQLNGLFVAANVYRALGIAALNFLPAKNREVLAKALRRSMRSKRDFD